MRQITPADLSAWLADKGRAQPVLLDVREPWEYEKARIAGGQPNARDGVCARVS